MASRVWSPIRTTTVAVPGSSDPSTGAKADSAWPETTRNAEERPRWVTGMPESPGAATAADTPGTTSQGIPAAASAALEPDHPLAAERTLNHQPLDGELRDGGSAGALAHVRPSCSGRVAQDRTVDERVVEDHVRSSEPRNGAQGQELGVAGAGPDQGDESRTPHPVSPYR